VSENKSLYPFMSHPSSADSELLKSLLEPLLDDFQYWLGRSQVFLEENELSFISLQKQADLLSRVVQAKQEVTAAQALFQVTGGQVGVETAVLAPWHQLISECWQVSQQFRKLELEKNTKSE
jgi:Protein of unknown function (DUF2605)